MKRLIALLLALLMALSLAACGDKTPTVQTPVVPAQNSGDAAPANGDSNPFAQIAEDLPAEATAQEPAETPAAEPAEAPAPSEEPAAPAPAEAPAGSYILDNQVLVDNEYCTVTAVKIQEDAYGPSLKLLCENKTESTNLKFAIYDCSVNGYMVNSFFSETVTPGKKTNADMSFDSDELKEFGIVSLDEILLDLKVYDNDDWSVDNFVDEFVSVYPTGLTHDQVKVPERKPTPGEAVLYEDENVTFVILGADPDGYWGYTLNCFIENHTDLELMLSWDDVSVNGFMIDPYWAFTVMPNSRTYADITFDKEDIDNNGITEITELELKLTVYDNNDWWSDYIVDHQVVTFTR